MSYRYSGAFGMSKSVCFVKSRCAARDDPPPEAGGASRLILANSIAGYKNLTHNDTLLYPRCRVRNDVFTRNPFPNPDTTPYYRGTNEFVMELQPCSWEMSLIPVKNVVTSFGINIFTSNPYHSIVSLGDLVCRFISSLSSDPNGSRVETTFTLEGTPVDSMDFYAEWIAQAFTQHPQDAVLGQQRFVQMSLRNDHTWQVTNSSVRAYTTAFGSGAVGRWSLTCNERNFPPPQLGILTSFMNPVLWEFNVSKSKLVYSRSGRARHFHYESVNVVPPALFPQETLCEMVIVGPENEYLNPTVIEPAEAATNAFFGRQTEFDRYDAGGVNNNPVLHRNKLLTPPNPNFIFGDGGNIPGGWLGPTCN